MDENGRDTSGRFAPGHAPHPRAGRPRGQSITSELRRQADPEQLAKLLIEIAMGTSPMYSPRQRLQAIELITNRIEGMPTSTLHIAAAGRQELPTAWDSMSDAARIAWLDGRALAPGDE